MRYRLYRKNDNGSDPVDTLAYQPSSVGEVEIPGPHDPTTMAKDLCTFIPQAYQDKIADLYRQERALILERRNLVEHYRQELSTLPTHHPELLI